MDLETFDRLGYVHHRGALSAQETARLQASLRVLEARPDGELPPACPRSRTPMINEARLLNVVECGAPFEELIDHPAILPEVAAVVKQTQEAYDFRPDAWRMLGVRIEASTPAKRKTTKRKTTKRRKKR